jgi:hypothetical protein
MYLSWMLEQNHCAWISATPRHAFMSGADQTEPRFQARGSAAEPTRAAVQQEESAELRNRADGAQIQNERRPERLVEASLASLRFLETLSSAAAAPL